mmetsp:Transcript_3022/g.8613  ORF Transcript_3022/g.8613 Transcript_3022/m.8613 type:complete len:248 (+) Transcript_3022:660-1403(+)
MPRPPSSSRRRCRRNSSSSSSTRSHGSCSTPWRSSSPTLSSRGPALLPPAPRLWRRRGTRDEESSTSGSILPAPPLLFRSSCRRPAGTTPWQSRNPFLSGCRGVGRCRPAPTSSPASFRGCTPSPPPPPAGNIPLVPGAPPAGRNIPPAPLGERHSSEPAASPLPACSPGSWLVARVAAAPRCSLSTRCRTLSSPSVLGPAPTTTPLRWTTALAAAASALPRGPHLPALSRSTGGRSPTPPGGSGRR